MKMKTLTLTVLTLCCIQVPQDELDILKQHQCGRNTMFSYPDDSLIVINSQEELLTLSQGASLTDLIVANMNCHKLISQNIH